MADKNDISTHCVVRDRSPRSCLADTKGRLEDCEIVDSVQRLMSLGVSAGEIRELGMAEGAVEALCEYARLDESFDGDRPGKVVDMALGTLMEETRKVDLELEMLGLRKRALTKRAKLLHKLAAMLQERGKG